MPRRFSPRSPEQWQHLASRRIINILRRRRLCNLRQLESKISEAGPANMRAQPLSIRDALDDLLSQNTIVIPLPKNSQPGIHVDFYALKQFSLSTTNDRGRYEFILEHWPRYTTTAGTTELCGDVLENIVDAAISTVPSFVRVGHPGKAFNNYVVDGLRIDNSPPLDHVLYHPGDRFTIGVEDKNWREWVYPNDDCIRVLLKKCGTNNHVPVFITRKLPYITRLLFVKIGVLGFETHFHYFHPDASRALELAKHRDGLGFADIRFTLDPPRHLLRFFQSTLPNHLSQVRATFEANKALAMAYGEQSIDYKDFVSQLGVFGEPEELDGDYFS